MTISTQSVRNLIAIILVLRRGGVLGWWIRS